MSYISNQRHRDFRESILEAQGFNAEACAELIKLKQGIAISDLDFFKSFFKSTRVDVLNINWTESFLLWLNNEARRAVKNYVPEVFNKEFMSSSCYVEHNDIEINNSNAFDKLNIGLCPEYERTILIKYALLLGINLDTINKVFKMTDEDWKEFTYYDDKDYLDWKQLHYT